MKLSEVTESFTESVIREMTRKIDAAVEALDMPQNYYDEMLVNYNRRRQLLYEALLETGLEAKLPQGSYYIMTEADRLMDELGVTDDFELSKELIELAGVAAVPGSSFYSKPGEGENKIS